MSIEESTKKHLIIFDFLTYKLGKGEVEPSFNVEYNKSETTKVKVEVDQDINNLLDYYKVIKRCCGKKRYSRTYGIYRNEKSSY